MNARGFSLPEVMVALLLFASGIATLAQFAEGLATAAHQQQEYLALWRRVYQQAEPAPPPLPAGWTVERAETLRGECVSISVAVTSPGQRRGAVTRLHCATGAQSGAADVKGLPF